MTTLNKEAPERHDIEVLLPWHAAGTLSRRDSDRVERAIAVDGELAHRYQLVREELGETIHLNESLGAPSSRAMERLFAAIDKEAPVVAKPSFNVIGRVMEFMSGFNARSLAYAASAAAVVLVLMGTALTTMVVRETGSYNVASASGGRSVWVRFSPQATVSDVNRILNANQAVLAGGPIAGGGYLLRPTGDNPTPEDFERLEQQLKAEGRLVEFVARKG